MFSNAPSPLRLLLVEPNRAVLKLLATRFSEAGYRVIACDQPGNALAELYRLPVDAIVAELRMNQCSGIDLIRLVRDDSGMRDTPMIMITGRSDATGAIDAFGAGADDVVAKPFDFSVLLARVARRLARAKAVRELRADNATLDARVVTRAIELGETRAALKASEDARVRLETLMRRSG